MDFDFTEEQGALRDALSRQLERSYSFDKRKQIVASAEGWSDKLWQQLAEQGALAVALPEAHGGMGGTAIDTLVVMEELGKRLVVEPYLSSVVLGAGLVQLAGSEAQRAAILPEVAAGKRRMALAHDEPDGRYELAYVRTQARRDEGGGYVLNGKKHVVLGGEAAQTLIVSARLLGDGAGEQPGEPDDPRGLTLFVVDAAAPGVSLLGYRTQDSHRAADVTLSGVRASAADVLGEVGGGYALLERITERAIAAVCAEALGVMTVLMELTSAYVKTRQQFGVPIGSFQALQHRLADMLMRIEQTRSMALLAAATVESDDAPARRRVLSAAKALVSQAARFVGQQAIQLHGGIGVTDEAPVSHYFKRLTMLEMMFGDADHHLARFSDAMPR